jgi:hypothetical protein
MERKTEERRRREREISKWWMGEKFGIQILFIHISIAAIIHAHTWFMVKIRYKYYSRDVDTMKLWH